MKNRSNIIVGLICLSVGFVLGALCLNIYWRCEKRKTYDNVIKNLSSLSNAYLQAITRGNLDFQKGNYDSSISFYKRAALIEPTNPLPAMNIADVYSYSADSSNAVYWLRKARNISEEHGMSEYLPLIDQKIQYLERNK